MKASHSDLVKWLEQSNYHERYWKIINGELHLYWWFELRRILPQYVNELPDHIIFHEECWLSDTNIKTFPDNIQIYKHLTINNTKITNIPSTIKVRGDLSIFNNENITLSDGLYINGLLLCDDKYRHLNTIRVKGYYFNSGILS